MIKHSVSIFLCVLMPFMLSAKIKAKQDTTAIPVLYNSSSSDDTSHTEDIIPTVTLEDAESNDEGSSDQGVSPVLNAGRDPFLVVCAVSCVSSPSARPVAQFPAPTDCG